MILDEIFKDKPELLEEPCVKELVGFVKIQHSKLYDAYKKYKDFHDRTLEILVHSELMIIDGKDSRSVLKGILEEMKEI